MEHYDGGEEGLFFTKDIILASWLSYNNLVIVKTRVLQNPKRVGGVDLSWGYTNNGELQELIDQFSEGNGQVEPKAFYYQVQSLRSMVYDIRKNN